MPLFLFGTVKLQDHTMDQIQDRPWEPAWEPKFWMVFYSAEFGWATYLRFHILPYISLANKMIVEKKMVHGAKYMEPCFIFVKITKV